MGDVGASAWKTGWWAVAAAAAAALAFSLYLVAQTRPGVFYSGDAGLKFLMTAGFASGDLSPELRLAAPPWVRELWAGGLFPFEPPFAYELNGRMFAQYPPWFALASVPGYVVGGFSGLYAVPLIGLWLTWAALVAACRGVGVGPGWTAAALVALAFSSPLTLYGAMFWEHTAGVSLSLAGFTLVFGGDRGSGTARAAFAGMLLGLSVLFRPELAVLATIALTVVWTAMRSSFPRRSRLAATIAVAAILLAAAAINVVAYGRPAGLHSLIALAGFSMGEYLSGAATILWRLGELMLLHFPLVIPYVLVAVFAFSRRLTTLDRRVSIWLWSGLAFSVLVPLILPGPRFAGYGGKQWGPRYLLAAMPILSVAGAASLQATWRSVARGGRVVVVALTGCAFAYGLFTNAYAGTVDLQADYAGRVLPALEAVRASPAKIVAVSNQYVSQELAATMQLKSFVLARDGTELDAVGAAALGAGVHQFLFVSDAGLTLEGLRSIRDGSRPIRMSISLSGVFGAYAVHEVKLEWDPM
jgi:hypothetical protein